MSESPTLPARGRAAAVLIVVLAAALLLVASVGGKLLGAAEYGLPRPDVGAQLGDARFAPSGFRFVWPAAGVPGLRVWPATAGARISSRSAAVRRWPSCPLGWGQAYH